MMHLWRVTFDRTSQANGVENMFTTAPPLTTSYQPPSITKIPSAGSWSTKGGQVLQVDGTNLGPPADSGSGPMCTSVFGGKCGASQSSASTYATCNACCSKFNWCSGNIGVANDKWCSTKQPKYSEWHCPSGNRCPPGMLHEYETCIASTLSVSYGTNPEFLSPVEVLRST